MVSEGTLGDSRFPQPGGLTVYIYIYTYVSIYNMFHEALNLDLGFFGLTLWMRSSPLLLPGRRRRVARSLIYLGPAEYAKASEEPTPKRPLSMSLSDQACQKQFSKICFGSAAAFLPILSLLPRKSWSNLSMLQVSPCINWPPILNNPNESSCLRALELFHSCRTFAHFERP